MNHYLIAGLGSSDTRYFIDDKQVDAVTYYKSLERYLKEKEKTTVGCPGCGVGLEPHGPDCPVKT